VGSKERDVRVEAHFAVQVAELAPRGSRERAAVMRAYNRLRREDLPGAEDEGPDGERGRVFATDRGEARAVRKVPRYELWIWYRATPSLLVLSDLTDYSPQDVPW
jgi:hypothetical protein